MSPCGAASDLHAVFLFGHKQRRKSAALTSAGAFQRQKQPNHRQGPRPVNHQPALRYIRP